MYIFVFKDLNGIVNAYLPELLHSHDQVEEGQGCITVCFHRMLQTENIDTFSSISFKQ